LKIPPAIRKHSISSVKADRTDQAIPV
jgi:hypothetical protein